MKENGRKNIFGDNQTTNKIRLMFLDVKVLMEASKVQWYVFTVSKPQNKQ